MQPPHLIPPVLRASAPAVTGDATGGLIPYKNPSALTAYYLGLFSLFPVVGLLLGVVAIVLGIRGIRYRRKHPQVRGTVHAWVGICTGAIFPLIQFLIIVAIFRAA